MVDAIQCARDGGPTQCEAPEAGGKMKALFVVGLTRISAGAKAVATALIGTLTPKLDAAIPALDGLAMKPAFRGVASSEHSKSFAGRTSW